MRRVKNIILIVGLLGLSACAGQQPEAMTLAMNDPQRFAHLYAAVQNGGYDNKAFAWVDVMPLPKR